MEADRADSIPPAVAKRRVVLNLWIAVVAPFLIVGGGVGLYIAAVDLGVYAGAVAAFFAVIGIVPVLAGFLISLRWKLVHPGLFVLIGLGMSAAAGCVWAGCVWGFCSFA